MIEIREGDCLQLMVEMAQAGEQFDGAAVDPPYHLGSILRRFGGPNAAPAQTGATGAFARVARGFMGHQGDSGDIAFRPETWALVYDLLRPGSYLAAFAGTRGYHRMACAIEDAGFIVMDMVQWQYGSGMPKNHNVAKAIDRRLGNPTAGPGYEPVSELAKEFAGFGTALKPAQEPICIAMKPREGNIIDNLLTHGTGLFNIDACRVELADELLYAANCGTLDDSATRPRGPSTALSHGRGQFNTLGRWPANVLHDDSLEILGMYPRDAGARGLVRGDEPSMSTSAVFNLWERRANNPRPLDNGSAGRFFYSGKAKPGERVLRCSSCGTRYMGKRKKCCGEELVSHPTIKPVDVMRWLLRLTVRPGGRVLDPFAGTGTTGIAAAAEGMRCTLIERDPLFAEDIRFRAKRLMGLDLPLLQGAV